MIMNILLLMMANHATAVENPQGSGAKWLSSCFFSIIGGDFEFCSLTLASELTEENSQTVPTPSYLESTTKIEIELTDPNQGIVMNTIVYPEDDDNSFDFFEDEPNQDYEVTKSDIPYC